MSRLILLFIFFVSSVALAEKELKMWLATSVRDNLVSKLKADFEKETGIKIVYAGDTTTASSNTYLIDVINGKVEAAASPIAFDDWVKAVKKEGVSTPPEITHRVIGFDKLKLWVNPATKITKLPLDKLEPLFTGQIKSWKELGGADIPTTLVYCSNKTATNTAFQKIALKGKEFGGTMVNLDAFDKQMAKIAEIKGGFGITPSTIQPIQNTTLVETPPLGRPITLVTKGKPSENLQKFIEYVNIHGKKYLN